MTKRIALSLDNDRFSQLVNGERVEWLHDGFTIQLILSDIGFTVMRTHIDNAEHQREQRQDCCNFHANGGSALAPCDVSEVFGH